MSGEWFSPFSAPVQSGGCHEQVGESRFHPGRRPRIAGDRAVRAGLRRRPDHNEGKGLPYQSYLAPRPATVLIYANPDPTVNESQRQALYAGLQQAGHKLTVVTDTAALSAALRERHFDVVIAAFDSTDMVAAAAGNDGHEGKTTLIPVVAKSERNSPQGSSHYSIVLVDGASLGQYLKTINTIMSCSPPPDDVLGEQMAGPIVRHRMGWRLAAPRRLAPRRRWRRSGCLASTGIDRPALI